MEQCSFPNRDTIHKQKFKRKLNQLISGIPLCGDWSSLLPLSLVLHENENCTTTEHRNFPYSPNKGKGGKVIHNRNIKI